MRAVLRPCHSLVSLSLCTLLASSCASLSEPAAGGRSTGRGSAPPPGVGTSTTSRLPAVDVPDLSDRALLLMLVDRQMIEPLAVRRGREGGPGLRRALAVALGRIGDPAGREVLEDLLFDDEVQVRREAAFALGELERPEAERVLLARADEPDRETGALLVEALSKIDTPVRRVLDALGDLAPEERWARLLPHLFRFDEEGDEEEVVVLARQGLAAVDATAEPKLHAMAAYALARNPRPSGADDLRGLLDDPDPWVRGWAARALGQVGEPRDLPALRPLLDDPTPGPIVHALRSAAGWIRAGRTAAPDAWRDRLLELVRDPRPQLRLAALRVAGLWLLDPELGRALVPLADEGTPWERAAALEALATGGHPRARDLLDEAARDPSPVLREGAVRAADSLGDDDLVERMGRDLAPRVRVTSLELRLGEDDEPGPEAVALARRALTDTDPGVRAFVFSWLEERPVVPLEDLGEALIEALQDLNTESSLAGVRALRARADAEPLERGALIALIERLAESEDYLVRREAIAALEALEVEAPPLGTVETGRGVGTYELVLQRAVRPRTVEIRTVHGPIRVRLACPEHPLTCVNFLNLAAQGFFDGLTFHRVVPDFVVQGGDPRGDGYGGPSYTIRDEIGRLRYGEGVLGMALAGADTGSSQFFLTLAAQPHLDGGYTAFGEVVAGMEVLERIAPHDVIETVRELE